MERRTQQIGGRKCTVWMHGQGGPEIFWGVAQGSGEQGEAVASLLADMAGDRPWTLVAYEVSGWHHDFSPWASPSVRGQEEFTGGGKETLRWLAEECIPHIEARMETGVRLIGGYSLSGLFSLFAFYESRLFQGAASCSGSLWYPGWVQYARRVTAPQGSVVYLSLGIKEEKTRSRAMAAVGDETRRQFDRLRADGHVRDSALVWHPGGHFNEPTRRIAQGFAWLIERV